MMTKEDFYLAVAEVLEVEYTPSKLRYNGRRSNRWGPRAPGNGRFDGFGMIRWFGPKLIHVSLNNPISCNRQFSNPEAVLEFLRELGD